MLYYLNKIMHSVDWYYEIELPDYWTVEHPVGSVLGRAKYSDGFHIYQGCTVGGTVIGEELCYPTLGKNVFMCSNSSILGKCNIGDDVTIGAGCIVKNQDVPDNTIVFGQSPNLIFKTK